MTPHQSHSSVTRTPPSPNHADRHGTGDRNRGRQHAETPAHQGFRVVGTHLDPIRIRETQIQQHEVRTARSAEPGEATDESRPQLEQLVRSVPAWARVRANVARLVAMTQGSRDVNR